MSSNSSQMKVFAAGASRKLASKIADKLSTQLGNSETGRFSDGEISVSIKETVRDCDTFIVQSTSHPVNDNLMELLIMIDAFKRASARSVTAVIPYFGYARQDRKVGSRDPISAKLVADLITSAGADRVLSMDLHAPQIQGFFNIPVDHLFGVNLLAPYYINKFGENPSDVVAVSPDFGSVNRARKFSHECGTQIAVLDKKRARANESEVMNIIGDVENKTCILVDDMIDTAGSLCGAARALIERGGAKEIYACASHGVLSGVAIERLESSPIKEVLLLDTIDVPNEKLINKINMLSVADIFAEAIYRIFSGYPITSLIDERK